MDPTRKAIALTNYEGERAIDGRFRTLTERIPEIIREIVGDRPIEEKDRAAIMARVDRELNRFFPSAPGGPSVLQGDIQEFTNRSRSRAVKAAMEPVIDAVKTDPELWEAIRGDFAPDR